MLIKMDTYNVFVLFGTLLFFFSKLKAAEDKDEIKLISSDNPCAEWQIANRSVACVCNSTYCDTITKEPLIPGQYVVYRSAQSGLRFNKTKADLQPLNHSEPGCTLVLHPEKTYQTVEGFGSSVSDAAGINWKNLSDPLQKTLIDSYFSDTGLQYNMIRVPIGGTDFSTHAYAYNDLPVNDAQLSNYSLSYEDFHYKIPMIKAAMQTSSTPIHVIATTWSPPPWMKTNNAYTGRSRLWKKYYQTYADYHIKFMEQYEAVGIPVWAITTTNEPTSGLVGYPYYINNLGWTARSMLVIEHPKVLDYIDGIGVHYYTDFMTSAAVLTEVAKLYPDKFIIATEACEGMDDDKSSRYAESFQRKRGEGKLESKNERSEPENVNNSSRIGTTLFEQHHVDLGSWKRAKNYVIDIIDDFNHGVVGWIDWNMCLNIQGGPTYINNFADSPIIVVPEKNEFIKQPMFYAMGHFSKFVPRESRRIDVSHMRTCGQSLWNVAFLTPNNTTVMVLYNDGNATKVNIQLDSKQAVVQMEANSVATVEIMTTVDSF